MLGTANWMLSSPKVTVFGPAVSRVGASQSAQPAPLQSGREQSPALPIQNFASAANGLLPWTEQVARSVTVHALDQQPRGATRSFNGSPTFSTSMALLLASTVMVPRTHSLPGRTS